jgi:Predicted membrane protein
MSRRFSDYDFHLRFSISGFEFMNRLTRLLNSAYQVFRLAFHEFILDDGINLAAGLSFFAILSLIPLVLIVISFLGHLLGKSDLMFEQITVWVQNTLPAVQPEFIFFLRSLVDKKLTSGWIGIGFLFFVASLLFTNIEHILDKILKSSRKRNFWHSRVLSIGLILVTGVFLFVPYFLKAVADRLPVVDPSLEFFGVFQGNALYFFVHGLVFTLMLRFVPNESMRLRHILQGGLWFALFTVVARNIFRWYMGLALERYSFIYGSLTVLVLLILWIYYLSLLFVFCGELVSALQKLFPPEAPSE